MQKIFCLIIILFLLTSCQTKSRFSKNLILSLPADPLTLNPILAQEIPSITVNNFIFNTLLKYNEKMQIAGDLAEKWKVSKDGKIWTFYLRKNVFWHDGFPFTSKDVKFTFDKLFEPSTNTVNRALFQVEGKNIIFKIISPYIIQAILPESFAPFSAYLTSMGIIPEHLLKNADINHSEFNIHPIGTGPFKFKYWNHSDHIFLERFPDYFNGSPKVEGIIFRIIPSLEISQIALKTQEIDQGRIGIQDFKVLKNLPYLKIYETLPFSYTYLGFDLTDSLFKDLKVRRAINYAINRKKILEVVLHNLGEIATGPIPRASWAYNPNVPQYEYNLKKAKDLIKETGWRLNKEGILENRRKKFEFNLIYTLGKVNNQKAVILIQSFLKEIGIKVNLRPVEFSVLIKSLNPGKFQAVILDWEETPDPDCFTEWDSSQMGENGMNFMSYKNLKVNQILRISRRTLNMEKRKKLYFKFQELVVADAPYVFLWTAKSVYGINKRITNLPPPNPLGMFIYPEKLEIKE